MANVGDDDSDLIVKIGDGVAVLTLNRPERLNALSRSMVDAAIAALERCAVDAAVGCIVVTGAGRGFCAGGDVTAMGDASADADRTVEQKVDRQRSIHRLCGLLHASPKPTVAAINGACLGGGLEAALAGAYRVASDAPKTVFALPEVQLGLIPGAGGTQRLPRLVGLESALESLGYSSGTWLAARLMYEVKFLQARGVFVQFGRGRLPTQPNSLGNWQVGLQK